MKVFVYLYIFIYIYILSKKKTMDEFLYCSPCLHMGLGWMVVYLREFDMRGIFLSLVMRTCAIFFLLLLLLLFPLLFFSFVPSISSSFFSFLVLLLQPFHNSAF
ncbi:hypothetical protein, conserved [Trypanosoma brucei gambiense DAL972]|uniref:Uncharacterized protein n=1 Tax=Trypanosoma brucei gambiense (strain MHOM/CI/86/DAL972) TaxID=679716 RepID=C9ZZ15_TRYB9|nr:hypothetical protein, conserved [Trypanosoma brucei gambiense DAL972]CBH14664.1 hypothetical protein, conserved [Trypanosoma brucei gambiense DAL972]|eukprot:XP_011776930.1 hypothetical protein, conserved [Trypanosoma brucei gambiense DAL972]